MPRPKILRYLCGALAAALSLLHSSRVTAQISSNLLNEVYTWAPLILAETDNQICHRCYDHILSINFDADWDATNNWVASLSQGSLPDTRATIYFSAVESGTSTSDGYYFLGYYFYHAKDAGANCCGFAEPHENDLEGVFLVVKKDAYVPQGKLMAALTQAHGALLPYVADGDTYAGGGNHPCCQEDGHTAPWIGKVMSTWVWWDVTDHPIVILRARDHAAYMAYNCTAIIQQYGEQIAGKGWYPTTSSQGYYAACLHGGNSLNAYQPEPPGFAIAQPQPWDATGTIWDYRLVEIATSNFWLDRNGGGPLYTGNPLSLVQYQTGLPAFASSYSDPNPGGANPPWQWTGGQGCHVVFGSTYCWYDFSTDNTPDVSRPNYWYPYRPGGPLLIDPNDDISHRFRNTSYSTPWLPGLDRPYSYNPYLGTAPPPPPPPPPSITISIAGPDYVQPQDFSTWSAVVSGGTGPYTYSWSGPFSGSGSSISGSLNYADTIFLTVTDANGASATASKPVTVCYDGSIPCSGS